MSQSETCVSRHHGSWGRPGHGQLTAACHLALRDQQRGAVRSPAAAQPSTCSCSWPAAVRRSWRRCGQVLVLDGAAAAARLLGGLALTEAGLAEAGDTELGGGEDGWRLHQPRPARSRCRPRHRNRKYKVCSSLHWCWHSQYHRVSSSGSFRKFWVYETLFVDGDLIHPTFYSYHKR